MPSPSQSTTPKPPRDSRPEAPPPDSKQPSQPWRTEGLPPRQPPSRKRPRWLNVVLWAVASLVLFTMLTTQERLSQPDAVPYTEFKGQVKAHNVAEVFARGESIEGALKKDAPLPGGQQGSYKQFTTERPTFAKDDLLAELASGGATVRAKPLVQQRGFLMNLLVSFAPLLLLFGFWIWMLRRQQQSAMGGILAAVSSGGSTLRRFA